jgi:hypothetical protein
MIERRWKIGDISRSGAGERPLSYEYEENGSWQGEAEILQGNNMVCMSRR